MSRLGDLGGRLYRGEVSFNFVGRQRLWYTISGIILLVSVVALLTRGLNFSEEFKGGASFQFPANSSTTQAAIAQVVEQAGGGQATIQHLTGHVSQWVVQTKSLVPAVSTQVTAAISQHFHIPFDNVSVSFVGATWGSQISSKAIEALIIFLVVIVIYLTIAFEWKMAIAAFVALMHDIVITVGVYALVGFPVAPASVIGLLTILGYSLYDTVVVFDKVRENTAGLLTTARSTYSEAANLALNQTLVRSINTSLTALLPVASILFIGGALLGTGTLNDLSLVLFVGMLSGTYSSIFIATPVLADLKEREPQYKELAARVKRRAAGGRAAQRAAAATVTRPGGGTTAATTATAPPVRAADAGTADIGLADEAQPDEAPDAGGDEVTVPAAQSAGTPARRGTDGARPVSRQQPRRGGSAQRRTGPRKKRR
jgi:preprotein translocase subunit SecF